MLYDYDVNLVGTGMPLRAAWVRSLLGDEFFANVVEVDLASIQVTDAELNHLKGLTQLRHLWLNSTQVTDIGLENLKGLTQLQTLFLQGTQVTDEGVKKLQQALPSCKIIK